MILPQIEQAPLFNSINFSLRDPVGRRTARLTMLGRLPLPVGHRQAGWNVYERDAAGIRPVLGQVARATSSASSGRATRGSTATALFYRNSAVGYRDITDGLSQTLAVGERGHRLGEATWTGSIPGAVLFPSDNDGIGYPRAEDGPGMILGHAGGRRGPGDPTGEVNQFYSQHPGGVNFLFADGSVRFLKTTMNYPTFRALATRSGGETISGDY